MAHIAPIHYKKLVAFFEAHDFVLSRTKGDHLIYTKKGIRRPLVIPKYKQIPVFVIKNNLRSAGINRDEYLREIKS